MRPLRNLLLCLVALGVALACELPGTMPKGDTWHLVLKNQKKSIYGGSACTPADNQYCKTWIDDATTFNGTLHRSTEWTLDVGDGMGYYALSSAGSLDTVIVDLLESGNGCQSYQLFYRAHSDSIFGNFLHTSDCHGAGNSGTFVGRP